VLLALVLLVLLLLLQLWRRRMRLWARWRRLQWQASHAAPHLAALKNKVRWYCRTNALAAPAAAAAAAAPLLLPWLLPLTCYLDRSQPSDRALARRGHHVPTPSTGDRRMSRTLAAPALPPFSHLKLAQGAK